MHEREKSVSTTWATGWRSRTAPTRPRGDPAHRHIASCATTSPIDWNGKPAEFVVGIAGAGDDHLALLSQMAGAFVDDDQIGRLRAADSVEDVLAVLDVGAGS